MTTYIALFNLTDAGIKAAKDSPRRLDAAKKLLADMGGEMKQFYMVMGEFDFVGILRGALRQLPFLPYLALRSLLYLGIILLVLIASNLRVGVTRADIAFSLAMSLGFNLLLGVNDLLGPGVLFRFLEKARLTTIP